MPPMHANEALIRSFYDAFGRRDAAAMVACYDPAVRFHDPVFLDLEGPRAGAMWKMLCARATDLAVEASGFEADDKRGKAHWDATYTFSGTGRKVLNRIDAAFEFSNGKIVRHVDTFDLWAWAGMALGAKGKLLGWAPFVQGAIRKQAAAGLAAWMAKNPA
jgi:ketosteroid isomerase-like protein